MRGIFTRIPQSQTGVQQTLLRGSGFPAKASLINAGIRFLPKIPFG